MRGRPYPLGKQAHARAMRREGQTIRQIAAALDVPPSTVGDWLRGEGEPQHFKTCWCGERFVSKRSHAYSCSRGHAVKRVTLRYGGISV